MALASAIFLGFGCGAKTAIDETGTGGERNGDRARPGTSNLWPDVPSRRCTGSTPRTTARRVGECTWTTGQEPIDRKNPGVVFHNDEPAATPIGGPEDCDRVERGFYLEFDSERRAELIVACPNVCTELAAARYNIKPCD